MEEFFFNGVWRLDWGLGNPNKTAALIVELMVAVWLLAYAWKWGFWMSLGFFTMLGGCLIHTFSRGGLAALIAGMLPLIVFASRPWSLSKAGHVRNSGRNCSFKHKAPGCRADGPPRTMGLSNNKNYKLSVIIA